MYTTSLAFVADAATKSIPQQQSEVAFAVRAADGIIVKCHPGNLIGRTGYWATRSNGSTSVPANAKQVDSHDFFALKAVQPFELQEGVGDCIAVEMRQDAGAEFLPKAMIHE